MTQPTDPPCHAPPHEQPAKETCRLLLASPLGQKTEQTSGGEIGGEQTCRALERRNLAIKQNRQNPIETPAAVPPRRKANPVAARAERREAVEAEQIGKEARIWSSRRCLEAPRPP